MYNVATFLEDILYSVYFRCVIATVYETESINDIACVRDEMLDFFFFCTRYFVDFSLSMKCCWRLDDADTRIAYCGLRANCQVGPRVSARRDRAEGRKVWRM